METEGNVVSLKYEWMLNTLFDASEKTEKTEKTGKYFEICKQIIKRTEQELGIAEAEVIIRNMKYPEHPHMNQMTVVLYQKSRFNHNDEIRHVFQTCYGEDVDYLFYPDQNQKFSKVQRKEIETLTRLFYLFYERERNTMIQQELKEHDVLTGLYNQAGFLKLLTKVIKQNDIENYDAFFINLKGFKYINQFLGFDNGNKILTIYAKKLQNFLEEKEAVARLGGDNFTALIRRTRSDLFREFVKSVDIEYETLDGLKHVSIQAVCGIYQVQNDVKEPGDIMNPLSMSIQAAKQVYHQDYIYYSNDLTKKLIGEHSILSDFKQCLEAGEYVVYFQSKVRLSDGKICGAEALARWIHNGQVVPPCDFIPILERNGLICALDFEILRQTCQQIVRWKEQGIQPVRVSVNLSRWHLQNKNLVNCIMRILNQYQVEPRYIELELTETLDYEEYPVMCSLVTELKKYGIATAIDDFGTGYSSLNLLKKLDVDVLKLDKTFISEISGNKEKKDRILIQNIINMAKSLNVEVLAEGIEKEEQKKFLLEAGCDMAQGFLFAKPVPVDQFTNALAENEMLEEV